MTKRACVIRQSYYLEDLSVRREVETLLQAGFETHVIGMAQGGSHAQPVSEEVVDGVSVHYLPLTRKKTSVLRYIYDYLSFTFLAALKVTSLHRKKPFDVIQVNTMPDFLVFCTLVPKMMGAKVVVVMYEPVPELWQTINNSAAPFPLRLAEQWALSYADAALTVTEDLKEVYVKRGAKADKIQVILNVPDDRVLLGEGRPVEAPKDKQDFVLICHGAIEERYGHDTMLDAVALVRSQIPNLRLRILGKGSYVEEFLAKRAQLGLEDCVDYLGFVSLEQMKQELYAADVGIVAQKSSPYSNLVHTGKMYEFISIGKPVLASRLKSVESYFGQGALYFFEAGDGQSLAEGILALYRNPDLRLSLASNALKLYEQYNWENQKKIYLSVFSKLLDIPL
jgi:glycosyltransferase involved in cell wall biosynthesis